MGLNAPLDGAWSDLRPSMRILMILSDLPFPLNNGPNYQMDRLLRYLSQYYECHIIGFTNREIVENTKNYLSSIPNVFTIAILGKNSGFKLNFHRIICILKGKPLFLARWHNSNYIKHIEDIIDKYKYDLVFLDGLPVAIYLKTIKAPVILSTKDAISLSYKLKGSTTKNIIRKLIYYYNSNRIRSFEKQYLRLASYIHVVSEKDAKYYFVLDENLHLRVIPIAAPSHITNFDTPSKRETNCFFIYLLGNLGIESIAKGTRWFISKIYEKIKNINPNVKLIIIGKPGKRSINRYIENKVASSNSIFYYPWVEDYLKSISNSDIVVIPDYTATGIQNRVIAAMTLGKATIGRNAVFDSLPIINGKHCVIANNKKEFLHSIINLMKNDDYRQNIGNEAQKLVRSFFNENDVFKKWTRLINEAICKMQEETG